MLAISGVGAQKFERYGHGFINEIIAFMTEEQSKGSAIKGATHLVTWEAYKQGLSPDEIARRRNLNPITIYSHLATLLEQGYDIPVKDFVSKREYAAIVEAIDTLGPDAKLKELFEHLDERYEYFKIRLSMAMYKKQFAW
jgi:ATP-dependent DNA helicase RecQ